MFSPHEKVVYPGHGVAQISRIIEKKIANTKTSFFELKFLQKDMTILVPIDNAIAVGIRKLSTQDDINKAMEVLSQPVRIVHHEALTTNWNKRNKEYQGRLRTGDLRELCAIYRDLRAVELCKELSFGEKSLLQQTETLLVEEIAIVKNIETETAATYIRSLVCSTKQSAAAARA